MRADCRILVGYQVMGFYRVALAAPGVDGEVGLRGFWAREPMAAWVAALAAFTGMSASWVETWECCGCQVGDPTTADPVAIAADPGVAARVVELASYPVPGAGTALALVRAGDQPLVLTAHWNADQLDVCARQLKAILGLPYRQVDAAYDPAQLIDEGDRRRLFKAARTMNVDTERLREAIRGRFTVESTNQLTKYQANIVTFELIPELAQARFGATTSADAAPHAAHEEGLAPGEDDPGLLDVSTAKSGRTRKTPAKQGATP